MPSRAAAIRELLKRGLAAEGIEIPNDRAKSREFGVIDGPKAQKRPKAAEVLNGIGRAVVLLRRGGLDRLRRAPHNRPTKNLARFSLKAWISTSAQRLKTKFSVGERVHAHAKNAGRSTPSP